MSTTGKTAFCSALNMNNLFNHLRASGSSRKFRRAKVFKLQVNDWCGLESKEVPPEWETGGDSFWPPKSSSLLFATKTDLPIWVLVTASKAQVLSTPNG